jgi:hypothetical protein
MLFHIIHQVSLAGVLPRSLCSEHLASHLHQSVWRGNFASVSISYGVPHFMDILLPSLLIQGELTLHTFSS